MPTNPTNVKQLVDRLVALEAENTKLKARVISNRQKMEQMKGVAVALINRSTKQNDFSARQVKDWGEQILVIINSEKRPKDLRPKR